MRKKRKGKGSSRGLRGLAKEVYERWEEGLERAGEGFGLREGDGSRDPGDTDTAYLQCEIYRLTNELMSPDYRGKLEEALFAKLQTEPRLSFAEAPYFWPSKLRMETRESN